MSNYDLEYVHWQPEHDMTTYIDRPRIDAESSESKRIVRTCPRCGYRGHHWAERFTQSPQHRVVVVIMNLIVICCAECGVEWKGRYLADEWDTRSTT